MVAGGRSREEDDEGDTSDKSYIAVCPRSRSKIKALRCKGDRIGPHEKIKSSCRNPIESCAARAVAAWGERREAGDQRHSSHRCSFARCRKIERLAG